MIELTPSTTWCADHLEPFRPAWPAGYALATPLLFMAFVRLPEVAAYCGYDPTSNARADVTDLQRALTDLGPCCCKVDPDLLDRIVTAAVAGDADTVRSIHDELLAEAP